MQRDSPKDCTSEPNLRPLIDETLESGGDDFRTFSISPLPECSSLSATCSMSELETASTRSLIGLSYSSSRADISPKLSIRRRRTLSIGQQRLSFVASTREAAEKPTASSASSTSPKIAYRYPRRSNRISIGNRSKSASRSPFLQSRRYKSPQLPTYRSKSPTFVRKRQKDSEDDSGAASCSDEKQDLLVEGAVISKESSRLSFNNPCETSASSTSFVVEAAEANLLLPEAPSEVHQRDLQDEEYATFGKKEKGVGGELSLSQKGAAVASARLKNAQDVHFQTVDVDVEHSEASPAVQVTRADSLPYSTGENEAAEVKSRKTDDASVVVVKNDKDGCPDLCTPEPDTDQNELFTKPEDDCLFSCGSDEPLSSLEVQSSSIVDEQSECQPSSNSLAERNSLPFFVSQDKAKEDFGVAGEQFIRLQELLQKAYSNFNAS